MTLDEFAEMFRADLDAFVAATRRMQEAGEEGFTESRHQDRDYDGWLRQMAAYGEFVDVQEGN